MRERLGYNPEEEVSKQQTAVSEALKQAGILSGEPDRLIFDVQKFKETNLGDISSHLNSEDVTTALANLKVYTKEDTENPRELLPLPNNRQELLTTYPEKIKQALLKPWEVGNRMNWNNVRKLPSGEEVSIKELLIAGTLPREIVGRQLDSEQGRENLWLICRMIKKGLIKIEDGVLVSDAEAFKHLDTKSRYSRNQAIEALSHIQGYAKADTETKAFKDRTLPPRDMVALPVNLEDMAASYPQRAEKAILQIEQVGRVPWAEPIQLASGETTNQAELTIAKKLLSDLRARRDKKSGLEIFDGKNYVKFSTGKFNKLTGLNPSATDEHNRLKSFYHSGADYVRKFAPNLFKLGILEPQDFKIHGGHPASEIFNVNERKLNPKAPFLTFTTGHNKSARYYIGREKIVGTKDRIDPENTRAVQLDPNTVGIIENIHGKRILKRTFSLLSDEEVAQKQAEVIRKYGEKGKKYRLLADLVCVDAGEMKERIRKYNVTDYIPQRTEESPKDYAERVSRLSDVGFATKTFQNFFPEAGIGVHRLSWSEQLILADAMLEEKSKDRLVSFAKQYGVNGVRSFLSVDLDRKLGKQVLELGEKGDPKIVAEIFKKYAVIVDSVKMIESRCLQTFGKAFSPAEMNKVEENLFRKAKELLEGFEPSKIDSLEAVNVIGQLEHINEEVLLFASTFKVASEQRPVDFSEIKGVEIEIKDSGVLSAEDKMQMIEVYKGNRAGYEPQRLAQTVKEFEEVLKTSGKEFNLLKHNGQLLAFIRFDQLPNGNLYAGSLNVRPEARNSQIGMALLRATLDKKAETHNIEALAWSKLPMLKHYTGDFGFQITGELPNYHGQEMYYQLFRPKQERQARQQAA